MDTKVRILLVDDDPDVAWSLGRYLVRAGFAITTCTDGAEAIALLEIQEFDILITDIQMPRLNGLALIEWVRQYRSQIRVVVMTAFGSPSVQKVSLSKGAILYIEKPLNPDLIIDVLTAENEEDGISGSVTQIDLFDYIQLMMLTRRNVLLEISSRDGNRGRVYIKKGNIPHAVCNEQVGEAALICCLCFNSGRFSTLPWQEPEQTTITTRGDFLLMEAAKKRDEASWDANSQPSEESFGDDELNLDLSEETPKSKIVSVLEEIDE